MEISDDILLLHSPKKQACKQHGNGKNDLPEFDSRFFTHIINGFHWYITNFKIIDIQLYQHIVRLAVALSQSISFRDLRLIAVYPV